MGTVMDSNDIDSFIRDQKAKLATERQVLTRNKLPVDSCSVGSHLPIGDEEYRALWSKLHGQKDAEKHRLAHQTDEYKVNVTMPGMNESDNAKIQKEKERNEEYNQHIREKNEGRRPRYSEDRDAETEYFTTLPGLRDSTSAKRRKEQQRNAEYNLHLASKRLPAKSNDPGRPPLAPRKGWGTPVPSYEDLLDKKRLQESQYRRSYDAGYDMPPESERKLAELDKELEKKKARLRNERLSQGVLDDPTWLSPRKGPGDIEYENLPRRDAARAQPASYYTSLPLGHETAEEEKKRQQKQYRQELESQIREAADGKRRERRGETSAGLGIGEKAMDLKVDYSGYIDPEVRNPIVHQVRRPPVVAVTSTRRTRNLEPYHSKLLEGLEKLDQISPRSEVILGRRRLADTDQIGGPLPLNRGSTRGGGIGMADTGFESMLEAPRLNNLDPPPGLEYQPASYITHGGGGLGQSSVDEAYSFYATRNPLEGIPDNPYLSYPFDFHFGDGGGGGGGDGSGGGGRGRVRQGPASQEVSFAAGGFGGGGGGRSRVRFEEEKRRNAGQMDFPTDDDNKRASQAKAQAYQEELARQIEENKRKKAREREEKERYDRRLEQEAKDYNPYGRGGGGAPMKDASGNLVADLRSMRRDNDNPDSSRLPTNLSRFDTGPYYSPRGPANFRDDLIGPPPVQTTAEGEQSFARGGHGIFGMPKTDAEKMASERYKDDLRRQIEERKYEETRRKEKEREEEEREQRRVEEQQRRMQEEYEEEKRRIREKEEEAKRQNDELVRQAEERKREAERRRKEAEDQRQEDERREKEAELAAQRRQTSNSPPVPAVRTHREPVPSTSREDPPPARPQSADVLNQLAAMRKQLQNERQRVENMLQNEKNEPDVFDPRLVQRPPPAPIVRPEIDVFETALNRNPVPVHRTPGERPNTQAVEDFNALKHKDDSESRKEFRHLFPDLPSSGDTLEAQQAALLRQQSRNLHYLREQRQRDSGYPKTSFLPPPSGTQSQTPQQQLHSDSAFVDVDSVHYFPDDFDDIPASNRNESAQRRRYQRGSSPRVTSRGHADPFGSTASLNVDRLSKKNEDRLRRLRQMQGDDLSLYDPDDVLDRFMSKQQHNRPPSGQTLQDDSWMFPGSKVSGY